MNTLELVRKLVAKGEWAISQHAAARMQQHDILPSEVMASLTNAVVVEEYADAQRGPSVLVLQRAASAEAFHVVWGVPSGKLTPATVITAYRPDPKQWTSDLLKRLT
jgi:hypothetical protein